MDASSDRQPRVFISYSADTMGDEAIALRSALQLEGAAVDPAPSVFQGERIREALTQAIEHADLFVSLIAPGDERKKTIEFETKRMLEECWTDPGARIAVVAPAVGAIPTALRHKSFVIYFSHEQANLNSWSALGTVKDFARTLLTLHKDSAQDPEPITEEEMQRWRNNLVHVGVESAAHIEEQNESLRQRLVQDLASFRSINLSDSRDEKNIPREFVQTLLERALLAVNIGDQELTSTYYELITRLLGTLPASEIDLEESAYNLALVALESNDYQQAVNLFKVARVRFLVQYGAEHPATIAATYNNALALQLLGELAQAHDIYLEVLDLSIRVLGETHPQTTNILSNLSKTSELLGRDEDALQFARRTYAGLLKLRPEDSSEVHDAQAELARLSAKV